MTRINVALDSGSTELLNDQRNCSCMLKGKFALYASFIVASPSRRDAGFTIRLNDGKNKSLYFINFITK